MATASPPPRDRGPLSAEAGKANRRSEARAGPGPIARRIQRARKWTIGTGSFLQDWFQIKGYANPPWSLIGRVLSKVQMERAQIVLVAPVWKTQPWYPLLLQMLIAVPRLISHDQVMLYRDPEDLLPQLAVWHISGRDTETRSFQRKLPHSCSNHGTLRPISLTTHSLASGIAGVV